MFFILERFRRWAPRDTGDLGKWASSNAFEWRDQPNSNCTKFRWAPRDVEDLEKWTSHHYSMMRCYHKNFD